MVPELLLGHPGADPGGPEHVLDVLNLGGTWLANLDCSACPSACLGDLDANGTIDVTDVLMILANFGSICP